jgi:hypothetical protein
VERFVLIATTGKNAKTLSFPVFNQPFSLQLVVVIKVKKL